MSITQEFISLALTQGALQFGEFTTKAGRLSPYFFNIGRFDDGTSLLRLGELYAATISEVGLNFDMLFGAAYKGIPLVVATALAFAAQGRNVPFAYNRKEIKNHGDGGVLVGSALRGQVLMIDDVISAGTSVREISQLVAEQGAHLCAVAIALDREEKGLGTTLSAAQEVQQQQGVTVISIANLTALLAHLQGASDMREHSQAIAEYRARYGV